MTSKEYLTIVNRLSAYAVRKAEAEYAMADAISIVTNYFHSSNQSPLKKPEADSLKKIFRNKADQASDLSFRNGYKTAARMIETVYELEAGI